MKENLLLVVMASNLMAMASNLVAMAFSLAGNRHHPAAFPFREYGVWYAPL